MGFDVLMKGLTDMNKEESNNSFATRLAVIQEQKEKARKLNEQAQQNRGLSPEEKKLYADNYESITLTENWVKELANSSKNQKSSFS